MTSNRTAIRAENLSKRYLIGARQGSYKTLSGSLADSFRVFSQRLARRGGQRSGRTKETFWALQDINFDIHEGEVVGIIGRNGSGKSTLLKILTRITEPTGGWAEIRGRVSSLLEVGTGFHPELTGRENVFLNGAILGMRRTEIQNRFEEIVEFAEIGPFVDTPVKHYSSGMYLRLAFAVAAHLEPEVLLIDEVLAVGDMSFQRKCLGKMDDVARQGRTVVFVSHNMGAIRDLCSRVIVLNQGKTVCDAEVSKGIAQYYASLTETHAASESGRKGIRFGSILINGRPSPTIASGDPFEVAVPIRLSGRLVNATLFCILENFFGDQLVHSRIQLSDLNADKLRDGSVLKVQFPSLWLTTGLYTVHFKMLPVGLIDEINSRAISEKAMLDVAGGGTDASKASLTPPVHWSVSE